MILKHNANGIIKKNNEGDLKRKLLKASDDSLIVLLTNEYSFRRNTCFLKFLEKKAVLNLKK